MKPVVGFTFHYSNESKMKKHILTLTAVLLCALVHAQSPAFKYGLKAGLNLSHLSYDGNDIQSSGKAGFHVGLLGQLPISEKFLFMPEIIYSQQGGKLTFDEMTSGYHFESTMKLNYLNIPLMVSYPVWKDLSIKAGPQVGFLLSSKNDYSDNYLGDIIAEETNLSDVSHSVDFALNLGLGYRFLEKFVLDARYQFSFSNVFDAANPALSDQKIKNRNFQLSLGYFIQ